MVPSVKPEGLGYTHTLESKEYDSDSWVLLEDHPLRSYPTECCPWLLSFLGRCYAIMRRRCTERLFSLLCLFLMFLMVIHFLATLPYGVSYLLLRNDFGAQMGSVQWPAELSDRPSSCIAYNPHAHADAIQYSIDAGCTGITANIWLHNDELLVGDSASSLDPKHTLWSVYIKPLAEMLDARNPAVDPSASNDGEPRGLFDNDQTRPFTLFLQPQPAVQTIWPRLISQLRLLSQKDYLSYRNGTQMLAKPVRIVVSGVDPSALDMVDANGVDDSYRSILFDTPAQSLAPGNHGVAVGSENDHTSGRDSKETPIQIHPAFLSQQHTVTANFSQSISSPRGGRFSPQQIKRIKAQVQDAHSQGLQIRYQGIPCHSARLRRVIWRILVHEGADLIEVNWTGREVRWWRWFFTIGGTSRAGHVHEGFTKDRPLGYTQPDDVTRNQGNGPIEIQNPVDEVKFVWGQATVATK